MVFGTDLNKLHKMFDPAILPEELGGDLPHGDILSKVKHFCVYSLCK